MSRHNLALAIAVVLGLITGGLELPYAIQAAQTVSDLFINLLKLVSLPIIFLSIVSTASSMESVDEIKVLGKKVLKYTLLTTILAASIALILFVVVNPVRAQMSVPLGESVDVAQGSYFSYLFNAIPNNIVRPFSENNVIGVMFLAMLLSIAILTLPSTNRSTLHSFFSSLYAAIMKVTVWVVQLMPIAIWGFVALFVRDMKGGIEMASIALYLGCVVAANLIQGFVVMPILLKLKGLSPAELAKQMSPALSVAFFSKSSSATLPMAMKCACCNAGISQRVAGFSLPLCTTINMNGCAAFILTTVLFVSMSHGVTYTPIELVMWVFIATIAAVGNAGVPMGCYFLSSAFLAAMNVPLNILGIILPFYTLIDMLETAINVWSDSSVTAIVQKEVSEEASVAILSPQS